MTPRPDSGRPDERSEERRVRDALAGLPRVAPDPAFRARLAREFASGTIGAAGVARPRTRDAGRFRFGWGTGWAVGLAAAAAVALVWVGGRDAEGGPFRITRLEGSGTVLTAQGAIPLAESGSSGESRLPAGGELRLADGALEAEWPGVLSMRVQGATEAILPASDGGAGVPIEVEIRGGEILFVTGPEFPGRELIVRTPEGRVDVLGTAFAVWCDANGTCVCVIEGAPSVGVDDADLEPVQPGTRKVMPSGGGAPQILDVMPKHRDELTAFAERVHAAERR